MGEKEARETHKRYIEKIVPLITTAAPFARVQEYLQDFKDLRQELRRTADSADNSSARVGALREIGNILSKEIALQQHVGLIRKDLADARERQDDERLLEGMREILARYGVPAGACKELIALFSGESEE